MTERTAADAIGIDDERTFMMSLLMWILRRVTSLTLRRFDRLLHGR
jgi:hypothetical protein